MASTHFSPPRAAIWPPYPQTEPSISENLPELQTFSAITEIPLEINGFRNWVSHEGAGAILLFEGTVRGTAVGRKDVIALEYEVKRTMADKVIARIMAETAASIAVQRMAISHRNGRCELGEPTIIIAVSAAHRDEAYRASRTLIDRVKHEAPIWKREIFADGTGAWSEGCTACTHTGYHSK
jgi:molybdopterin synthase catalytic subunit